MVAILVHDDIFSSAVYENESITMLPTLYNLVTRLLKVTDSEDKLPSVLVLSA